MNRVFAHVPVEPIDASVAYSTPDRQAQPTEHVHRFDALRANPDLLAANGYVSLDQPHTSDATALIASAADHYALINEAGEIVNTFATLAEAEAAR